MLFKQGAKTGTQFMGYVSVFCLIGLYVSYGDARTASKYRNRPPDTVKVEDILNGKVQAGDWVTVKGVNYGGGIGTYEVTRRSRGGSTSKSAWSYHLLVSPQDPALGSWTTLAAKLSALEKRSQVDLAAPPQARGKILQSYLQLLQAAKQHVTQFKPQRGVLLRTRVDDLEQESESDKIMAAISPQVESSRDILRMASASPEERERLKFQSQLRTLQQPLRSVLALFSATTVTGLVAKPPSEVQSELEKSLAAPPTLEIDSGESPSSFSLYVFFISLSELLIYGAWLVYQRIRA